MKKESKEVLRDYVDNRIDFIKNQKKECVQSEENYYNGYIHALEDVQTKIMLSKERAIKTLIPKIPHLKHK